MKYYLSPEHEGVAFISYSVYEGIPVRLNDNAIRINGMRYIITKNDVFNPAFYQNCVPYINKPAWVEDYSHVWGPWIGPPKPLGPPPKVMMATLLRLSGLDEAIIDKIVRGNNASTGVTKTATKAPPAMR